MFTHKTRCVYQQYTLLIDEISLMQKIRSFEVTGSVLQTLMSHMMNANQQRSSAIKNRSGQHFQVP